MRSSQVPFLLAAVAAISLFGCARHHPHPPSGGSGGHAGGPVAGSGGSDAGTDSGTDAGSDSGTAGSGGAGSGGAAGGEAGSGGAGEGGMGGEDAGPPPNTPALIEAQDGFVEGQVIAGHVTLTYQITEPDGIGYARYAAISGGSSVVLADSPTNKLALLLRTTDFADGAIVVRVEVNDQRGETTVAERSFVIQNLDQAKNCADRRVLGNVELMLDLPALGNYQTPLAATCNMRWLLVAYESVLAYHGLAYPECVNPGLHLTTFNPFDICYPYLCVGTLPVFPDPTGVGLPTPGLHGAVLPRAATIDELVTELDNGRVVVIGDSARAETFVVYGYVKTPTGTLFWFSGSASEVVQAQLAAYDVLTTNITSLLPIAEPPSFTWNYTAVHVSPRADGCNASYDPTCAMRCNLLD